MLQGYNGKGQNQMKNPVRDIRCFSSGISTAAWQNPKGNGKNQDQYKRNPEFRDAAGDGAQPA